ncbi:hypothetical protein ACFLW0_01960 [Chloroflexota bacterium]
MSDYQKRILEMLAEKKISVDEAERLLALAGSEEGVKNVSYDAAPGTKASAKYLRVVVQPNAGSGADAERVNVRVPMNLIRAGIKLTSLIPPHAYDKMSEAMKEKGIDFDLRNIKTDDIEELVEALSDLEVDVESGKEKVHVYVE